MPNDDFHPDLRRIARFAPKRLVGPRSLRVVRALAAQYGKADPAAEAIDLAPGAGVRLFRPPAGVEPRPALLWIHGGGYVIGTARMDDRLCRRFSTRLGITVASVEYRLAPEHPYPAPPEDCYTALKWLAALPGVDRGRIAIGGASAGGGLAAALALLARDRAEIAPVFQLLVYPMIDDRSSRDGDDARHRLWNAKSNRFGWTAYLGDADPDVAVPARQEDLSGLPPAWIGVGTNDLFYDEDLAYAERLTAAGVPCEVEVVSGAFHGFDRVAPHRPVSRRFLDAQCGILAPALAG